MLFCTADRGSPPPRCPVPLPRPPYLPPSHHVACVAWAVPPNLPCLLPALIPEQSLQAVRSRSEPHTQGSLHRDVAGIFP
eukprot:3358869-Pyramimonas_sp.AAC.1